MTPLELHTILSNIIATADQEFLQRTTLEEFTKALCDEIEFLAPWYKKELIRYIGEHARNLWEEAKSL